MFYMGGSLGGIGVGLWWTLVVVVLVVVDVVHPPLLLSFPEFSFIHLRFFQGRFSLAFLHSNPTLFWGSLSFLRCWFGRGSRSWGVGDGGGGGSP